MEPFRQLAGNGNIAFLVQLAGIDIRILSSDAKDIFGILFIGDANIYIRHQPGHDFPGLFPGPQLAPVVQIAADGDSLCFGGLAGIQADFGQFPAQGRCDSSKVEPVCSVKDGVPVKFIPASQRNGGIGPVVNDFASPLGGSLFAVVNAQPGAAPENHGGIHPVMAQRIHCILADFMLRHLADKGCVVAVIGQGNRYIGFSAGISRFKCICLKKTLISGRVQPHHDFSESNDLAHSSFTAFINSFASAVTFAHSPFSIHSLFTRLPPTPRPTQPAFM